MTDSRVAGDLKEKCVKKNGFPKIEKHTENKNL